jgi:hypothetical protein
VVDRDMDRDVSGQGMDGRCDVVDGSRDVYWDML